ncbi:hypothetical protein Taro_026682 [Colocasia esculenta]|uniref:Uncharacterized protein n=1 Tax=Colocasia esculenta TaxID=4460 RepID=A0A843VPC4_COLES|nr:hypothetical protein [Colocasia esculenta]
MLRSLVFRRDCGGAVASASTAVARGLLGPRLHSAPLLSSLSPPSQGRDSAVLPHLRPQSLVPSRHFLDIYQVINKAAIEKERERLSDELNRGYFADIKEFNKHGGKGDCRDVVPIASMSGSAWDCDRGYVAFLKTTYPLSPSGLMDGDMGYVAFLKATWPMSPSHRVSPDAV